MHNKTCDTFVTFIIITFMWYLYHFKYNHKLNYFTKSTKLLLAALEIPADNIKVMFQDYPRMFAQQTVKLATTGITQSPGHTGRA